MIVNEATNGKLLSLTDNLGDAVDPGAEIIMSER